MLKSGQDKDVRFETELTEFLRAPVLQGAEIGTVNVVLNGTVIARIPAVAADSVRLPGFIEGLTRIGEEWK